MTIIAVFHICCTVNLVQIYSPALQFLHARRVSLLAVGHSGVVLWGLKQFKAEIGSAARPLEGLSV